MSSLPNYIVRSPKRGTYSFRLAVPEKLRPTFGKREIKHSLKTSDLMQARRDGLVLLERYRKAFAAAQMAGAFGGGNSDQLTPIRLYEAAVDYAKGLGITRLDLTLPRTPEEEAESAGRWDIAGQIADKLHRGTGTQLDGYIIEALQGTLKRPDPTIKDAVQLYLRERNNETKRPQEAKRTAFKQMVGRYESYLLASLGSNKSISSVTREDARNFRDYLNSLVDRRFKGIKSKKALKPTSVNKALQIVSAIFGHALNEWDIERNNPFIGLRVEDTVNVRDKRRAFSAAELRAYLLAMKSSNSEAYNCSILMAHTGARTSEITGLEVEDIVLDAPIPFIRIRPNSTRPKLKTQGSKRIIPLVGQAVSAATEALAKLKDASKGRPVFPRYSDARGADRLSALQNKAIREKLKVKDGTLSAYSTRHAMKDGLRNALVSPELSDAIMGHSKGQMGDRYGDGYWLPLLNEALTKAVEVGMQRTPDGAGKASSPDQY